eukprot:UN20184
MLEPNPEREKFVPILARVALKEASKTEVLLVKQSATVRTCKAPWTIDHSSSSDTSTNRGASFFSNPASFFKASVCVVLSNPHTVLR